MAICSLRASVALLMALLLSCCGSAAERDIKTLQTKAATTTKRLDNDIIGESSRRMLQDSDSSATVEASSVPRNDKTQSKVPPRPMSEARVFVVGLPKAGTTTLHTMFMSFARFSSLAGTSCHWVFKGDKNSAGPYKAGWHALGHAIHMAQERNLPLLEYAPGCRYMAQMDYLKRSSVVRSCPFSYWPQVTLLRELDHQYPGSRFILNSRPIQDHIESINHQGDLRERLVDSSIPGLPPGTGGTDEELGKWIENHNQGVRDYFQGRSQDFMEMKLGETSAFEVCQFLKGFTKSSKCLKHGEMPHANTGKHHAR